jgi:FkbM family methyltransferase
MLKYLKKKYLKNTNIYHLYRYFKYSRSFFPSYGATGEDVLINKIFTKVKNGFFVDVGALHPINGSLTYNLYKKGWNGVNIDMLEKNLELFKIFRKRDRNKNFAVSSDEGYVNAYIFERGSGLNTLDKNWADEWRDKINKDYSIHKIKKKTLSQILKNLNVKKKFELLNIDVEGHEYEVLKGFDFNNFKPIIITVEIHVKKTKEIFETQTYKILYKNKFELISHYHQTSFFKHIDSKI